jgi:hypothetical protein
VEGSVYLKETDFSKGNNKFNWDWKFSKSDNDSYNKMDFDDSSWRTLDLPHDWSIEGQKN